jgi:hypothetical protein
VADGELAGQSIDQIERYRQCDCDTDVIDVLEGIFERRVARDP